MWVPSCGVAFSGFSTAICREIPAKLPDRRLPLAGTYCGVGGTYCGVRGTYRGELEKSIQNAGKSYRGKRVDVGRPSRHRVRPTAKPQTTG